MTVCGTQMKESHLANLRMSYISVIFSICLDDISLFLLASDFRTFADYLAKCP